MDDQKISIKIIFERICGMRPVFIWGTGSAGMRTFNMFQDCGVPIHGFIDSNPANSKGKFMNLSVISPQELKEKGIINLHPYVIIGSSFDNEIRPQLRDLGFIETQDFETYSFFENLKAYVDQKMFVPPGHFYSPFPLISEIKEKEDEIFNQFPRSIPGVELNEEGQMEVFNSIKEFFQEHPFSNEKTENLRFYFDNTSFPTI